MKFSRLLLIILFFYKGLAAYAQNIENLKVEYQARPLGIESLSPRLSWEIRSPKRGTTQTFYQILVSDDEKNLAKNIGNVWDSKKIKSGQSRWVTYQGKPLESRKRYYWKVKIWDETGKMSAFSETSWWEMGLLKKEDWSAQWIGMKGTEGKPPKSVELEKTFTLKKRAVRARIYATGLGAYHLIFNGKKVGGDILAPGWTHYLKTMHYQTYEIDPENLTIGSNFITATLGNGWWSSGLGWEGGNHRYSEGPCRMFFQMEMEFYDGSRQTVISDQSWQVRTSPVTSNSIYHGETYDARLEYNKQWKSADLLDDLENATTLFGNDPKVNASEETAKFRMADISLRASPAPQIRVVRELQAVNITEPRKGRYVFDFGQNFSGFVRVSVEGKAGKEIVMKFGELLTDKGLVDQANLRSIRPTDKFILKGYGVEQWEPRFTYHGFRYVEVEGLPSKPDKNTIVAKVIHNPVAETGTFTSSDPLINKIYENIVWSQRSNMQSVPTDCPQRDERLGWMGDAQIFAPTASYIMDMNGFFTKWMRDITDSQHSSGYVYDINPKLLVGGPSKPAWGDAVVIVPWRMYQFYGDKEILRENYEAMKKWVDYMNNHPSTRQNGIYHFESGTDPVMKYGYGDWVPVERSPGKPIGGSYQYFSNRLLATIAGILGKPADATSYSALAEGVKKKYNELYFDKTSGQYEGKTQGANLIPLSLGLTSEADRNKVAGNVVQNVKDHNDHLTTGFISTAMLLPVLSESGHHDLAYKVATQKTYPGWGYMIEKGATSMWELWNSDTEKPEGMNSRNHFAYGSIGEWFYGYLAGIRPDDSGPGFSKFMIAPMPAQGLTHAEATYQTGYGKIRSAWAVAGKEFTLKVSVPFNTSATVIVPSAEGIVKETGKLLVSKGKLTKILVPGVRLLKSEPGRITLQVSGGDYEFVSE